MNKLTDQPTDSLIDDVLKNYKSFVVYGLSPDASKASNRVPRFMINEGYDCVGIYPNISTVEGIKIYQKLSDVPMPYRKFVDVFQRADKIPAIVDEVIAAGGVEVLWLQLGITHPQAEAKAKAHGIKVISDRCLKIEIERIS